MRLTQLVPSFEKIILTVLIVRSFYFSGFEDSIVIIAVCAALCFKNYLNYKNPQSADQQLLKRMDELEESLKTTRDKVSSLVLTNTRR